MGINDIRSLPSIINSVIVEEINKRIALLPVGVPVQVTSRTDSKVTCMSLLQLPTPPVPIEDIPIIKSKYYNYPVMVGDIGLAVPLSFSFEAALDGETLITPIKSIGTQNYYFIPLTATTEEVEETEKTVLTSQNGLDLLSLGDEDLKISINEKGLQTLSEEMFDTQINEKGIMTLKEDDYLLTINDKGKINLKEDTLEVSINDKGKFTVKEDNIELDAAGKAKITLDGQAGKVTISDGTNSIEVDASAGLTIEVGSAKITLGTSGAKVEFGGSAVELSASGVDVKGAMINLG